MLFLVLTSLLGAIASASALSTGTSMAVTGPPKQFTQVYPPTHQLVGNSTGFLTADEVHARVLANGHKSNITVVTTADYLSHDFRKGLNLTGNDAATHHFYLSDQRAFVTVNESSLRTTLESRQYIGCTWTGTSRILNTHAYWSPWEHLTSCSSSSSDKNGGSVYYSQEVSITTSLGGGISGSFEAFLTGAFDFSVSVTHGIATGFYCNMGAKDTVQVWGRHKMGWAQAQMGMVDCWGNTQWGTVGFVISPASSDNLNTQFGCSDTSTGAYLRCS